ncbi:MAG: glycosyltransferase [Acidobacteria bacterium]|nr:glycosyltransferase [Acidobacteriota bacterium]
MGIDAKALAVLGCGTRDLRKGIDLYIELAAYCARNKQPSRKLEFLWIGSAVHDPALEILQGDIKKLGRSIHLRFLGDLDNPYPYIAASDLLCLPSREDPFPLVMLEAGALGKPTLAFKGSGGAEEYCRQGGGFLAPYLDVAGMGDWILNRLADEKILSGNGRKAEKLIHSRYSLETTGPQYVRLINKLLRRDASAASGISQLFIPGITGYAEENSLKQQVPEEGWNLIRYNFHTQGTNNNCVIRFDPLDRIAVMNIAKIVLTTAEGKTLWKARTSKEFNELRVEGDAVRIPDAKILKLLSTGPDPILYLPKLGISETCLGISLDVVMQVDKSPRALAPHFPRLLHLYHKLFRLYREERQIHTPPSVDLDNLEKLGIAYLFSGVSINQRKIYIWGTGEAARHLGGVMDRQGYKFEGFIDRGSKNEGQKISEHFIFSPSILSRNAGKRPFIIIGSQFYPQVSRRLKRMGFTEGKDFDPSPFL